MWAYIREHDLQDPKNRRDILCDESLHSLFLVKTINMFQMNKELAKHIWSLNDGDGIIFPFLFSLYFFSVIWCFYSSCEMVFSL